ncbi:Phosphatidylinositol 4-phosphate 5-kinase 1 [Morella rubra]|nr:Phosphatidylinositol 4-phosphate 5-kinase 1 [Morella rubra]
MHGFGVYRFGNGHQYEGAWHEGRRQGLGMYTFRNGETRSGHWQDGVLDSPCAQLSHAGYSHAVYDTKVHNAVQEAKRAAEKTFNVGQVDERVKKAIAAANKAANAARVAAVKAVQNRMHLNNKFDEVPIPSV